MWVRMWPPFGDGKAWNEIPWPHRSGVKELIGRLAQACPTLTPHLRDSVEETFHQFILLRGDYVLRADDMIEPDDRIVVAMPLTGG